MDTITSTATPREATNAMNRILRTNLTIWSYDLLVDEHGGWEIVDCLEAQTVTIAGVLPALDDECEALFVKLFDCADRVRVDWTTSNEWTYELVHKITGEPIGRLIAETATADEEG